MDSMSKTREDDLRFGGFYSNAYGATLPKVSVLEGEGVWSPSLVTYMWRTVGAYVGDKIYEILPCFIDFHPL